MIYKIRHYYLWKLIIFGMYLGLLTPLKQLPETYLESVKYVSGYFT